VRAGADERRAAFALLVARRDAIGLLDAAARGERTAERDAIDAAMPALAAEHALHVAALDHARRSAAAEARFAEASVLVEQAASAVAEGRDDALRLAAIEAVEPCRRPADALSAAEAECAAAEGVLETARADVDATGLALAEIRTGLAMARAADEAGEAAFRGFTPTWSAADALDARIGELAREADAAVARAEDAKTTLDGARTRRLDLDKAYDTVSASRDATAARIAADVAMRPLADRGAEIAGLFEKRKALALERDAALVALKDAETRIEEADAATASARERATSARETRDGHIAERAIREEEYRAFDVDGTEAVDAHLRSLMERMTLVSDLARRHDRAWAEQARARASQADAGALREAAEARRIEAETTLRVATRARAEIAAMADLAERGASVEAANLRSVLVHGQPCPVCGSTEHPIDGGHGSDALTLLAETMRGRRFEIDAELAGAGRAITVAATAWADASARFEGAAREDAQAGVILLSCAEAYAGHRPDLAAACVRAGMWEPPDALGSGAVDHLGSIAEATAGLRALLAAKLERARALSAEIRVEGKAIAVAEGVIAAADRVVLAEAAPRQAAALAAERERTRAAAAITRVESIVRELGPILAPAGLDEAHLARNPDGTARRIAELGAAYRAARENHHDLVAALNDLVPDRAVAIEAEATATGLRETAVRAADDRATALGDARRDRAGLLGGEPTDSHRARITSDRYVARENHRMGLEASGIAAALHATATGSAEHADAQHRRARNVLAEAQGRFLAKCGLREPDTVLDLLAVPPEALTALREARDRLLRAHEAAEAGLAARRTDLDALRCLPPVDVPGTEAAAVAVAGLIATHQRRRGALDAELARDDDACGKSADLSREIATAREGLDGWEMVDAAVGSANGDRFRRFAQGVTLEHLAHLANEQLRILSPRYALVRGQDADLALHVLDRDMGDELRGTRSLSGGERFLVALALALALSGLEGRQAFVDTLFIDEGFGSLDAETLDIAVDALETLQGQGRRVGVITHVAAMIDRIAVQVRVERRGNGRSTVRVVDGCLPG
jgi:exonuclease SbcC